MANTHERFQVKSYPTPISTDVLFFEVVDNVLPKNKWPPYGQPHWDVVKWPNHKLVFIQPRKEDGKQHWWYVSDWENQDDYNFEFSDADIGGTKFAAVKRLYVIPRDTFADDLYSQGALMPDVPSDAFSQDYVLAERQQVRSQIKEIDSLYVMEVHTYIAKTTHTQIDYDEKFGSALATRQMLYYRGEVIDLNDSNSSDDPTVEQLFNNPAHAFWGLQADGTMNEGRQLSTNWFVISNRMIVPEDVATSGRAYYTTIDYSWPAVLDYIDVDVWDRLDGGDEKYAYPFFKKEAFHGPCYAEVREQFYATAPPNTDLSVDTMHPLPISISTPVFALSVPPSLHPHDEIDISTGTGHPVYDYNAGTFFIRGTGDGAGSGHIDWPDDMVIEDSVSQFRGGYLRRTITIQAPTPYDDPAFPAGP
jgi:hypothetical protein